MQALGVEFLDADHGGNLVKVGVIHLPRGAGSSLYFILLLGRLHLLLCTAVAPKVMACVAVGAEQERARTRGKERERVGERAGVCGAVQQRMVVRVNNG